MWLNVSPLLKRIAASLKFLRQLSRFTCRVTSIDSFDTFLSNFICRWNQFINLNSSAHTLNILKIFKLQRKNKFLFATNPSLCCIYITMMFWCNICYIFVIWCAILCTYRLIVVLRDRSGKGCEIEVITVAKTWKAIIIFAYLPKIKECIYHYIMRNYIVY